MTSINTEVRDAAAVSAACQRLGVPSPVQGKTKLARSAVEGLAVQLPGWKYPVVFNTATGQRTVKNPGGKWGDQQHLGRFLQAYAVECMHADAQRRGHTVTERRPRDGSITLTIQIRNSEQK